MKRGFEISKTLYLYSNISSCHVHFYYIGNVCIESLYSDVCEMKVCLSCRNGLSPSAHSPGGRGGAAEHRTGEVTCPHAPPLLPRAVPDPGTAPPGGCCCSGPSPSGSLSLPLLSRLL